jgi:hypothetical protein
VPSRPPVLSEASFMAFSFVFSRLPPLQRKSDYHTNNIFRPIYRIIL